jgi:hypothetical protein
MKPIRVEKWRQNKGEKEEEKGKTIKNQTQKGEKTVNKTETQKQ